MTKDEIKNIHIDVLELPHRARNCLKNSGANNVGEIMELIETPARMVSIPNFGPVSFRHVRLALRLVGVDVTDDPFADGLRQKKANTRPPRELGTSIYLTLPEINRMLDGWLDPEIASKLHAAKSKVR